MEIVHEKMLGWELGYRNARKLKLFACSLQEEHNK